MDAITPAGIRRMRNRLGWTQADLARRLGTDPVTVSRWERGVTRPRPSARKRLRDLFDPADRPAGTTTFPEDPEARLRAVDRARREQLALKKG